MTFDAAPMDATTTTVTMVASAITVGGGTVALLAAGSLSQVLIGLVLFAAPAGAFGFSPAAYAIEPGSLVIRRRWFGRRTYRLTGDVLRAPWKITAGGIRVFGSGGFFGWYGSYWKPGVGSYHAYVTDRAQVVACTTDAGLVVVSPAHPGDFVALAREARG